MKLNVKAAALAGGILWCAGMLILTIASGLTNIHDPAGAGEYAGYGGAMIKGLMSIYPGYAITKSGIIIGAVYGFVDGLICCAVAAGLYNLLCGSGKAKSD